MIKTFAQKTIIASLALGLAVFSILPMAVGAARGDSTGNYGFNSSFNNIDIGTTNSDLPKTIAKIINIVLGFLGIVAVIFILYGGFIWMTAAGNEDKVGEARKTIVQGVIGLVIIFAAWAIASFVISQTKDIGGNTAGGGSAVLGSCDTGSACTPNITQAGCAAGIFTINGACTPVGACTVPGAGCSNLTTFTCNARGGSWVAGSCP